VRRERIASDVDARYFTAIIGERAEAGTASPPA
jgi:hypothetical protein